MRNFLKTNKLTQEALAQALGISSQYVNRMAVGRAEVPHHVWARIRQNSDWDSSMLSEPTAPAPDGEARPRADQAGRLIGLLEKKDEQIDRLLGIIEKLSGE